MKRLPAILMIMLMPFVVAAQESLKLASTEPAANRFFPLDAARAASNEKQNGVAIIREKKPLPLRNDKQQVESGFMRIDRARAAPTALPRTVFGTLNPVPSSEGASLGQVAPTTEDTVAAGVEALEEESDEIIGNREAINPVLALFDTDDSEALGSFSDVMLGKKGTNHRGHAFWPIPLDVKQYVSSGFGMRSDPFHGRQTFHGGIDIAASEGTAVLATHDATVTQVASDPRYGKYITLQHADGTLSRYGHLSGQNVRQGQRVKAGQVIGAVGNTGRSTGAHLDYRVSKNNTKFDPLSILSVPSSVAYKAPRPSQAVAKASVNVLRGGGVAMNALPKRPMVIRVQ